MSILAITKVPANKAADLTDQICLVSETHR